MPQNTPYWNLAQTAAWVVFRNLSVVERFSDPTPTVTAKNATYNPEHLKRLKKTKNCINCDLQGANLNGANLENADLQGANIEGTNLQGADLRNANIKGANLEGSKLDAEDIQIAKASGATNVSEPVVVAKKPSPTVIGTSEKTPKVTPKVDQQKRLELARRTQEALQVLGLYSGKLDGIIGVITKSAIQRWQKRNGYSGTGEVTELQLAKLEQEAITHLAKKKFKPTVTAKKTPTPKLKPVQKVAKRPDDIAVITANSNYRKLGKDIPNLGYSFPKP